MAPVNRGAVLGLLLLAGALSVRRDLDRTRDGGPRAAAPARVDLAALAIPSVNWGALHAPRPAYDPAGRDIFRWTPPPSVAAAGSARHAVAAPTRPVAAPPEVPYAYTGYLGPFERRMAVLDSGDGPVLAGIGEVLDGRWRVREIDYESITLESTAGGSGVTTILPMGGTLR